MSNSPARQFRELPDGTLVFRTELVACHERIDELKALVAELVGVYWGDGDGEPPACIQRAKAALSEEVQS